MHGGPGAGSPHGFPLPHGVPPSQERSCPSVPPAAGSARRLRRDLAAASCPTFKGTQSQTAGCSHILRAGTAALLVFTLQLVD